MCKQISNSLGCLCHYAGLEEQEKTRIMDKWTASTSTDMLIVATTALGLGIDIPDITMVIVLGRPFSFRDLMKQFGRAGRSTPS